MIALALGPAAPASPAEREWPPIQRPDGMVPRAPTTTQPTTTPEPITPSETPTDGPGDEVPSPASPETAEPTDLVVPPADGPPQAEEEAPEWTKVEPPTPAWLRVEPPTTPLDAPPPPPAPTRRVVDRPSESGRGMIIAAATLGVTGLIVKGVGTSIAYKSDREGRPFSDPTFAYVAAGSLYNPMLGGALALLGGGMAKRGRLLAYEDRYRGRSLPVDPIPAVGWSLFGTGVGLWAITRVVGLTACDTDRCRITVWESGYYGSLALTVPGMGMGARATAYQRYGTRKRKRRRTAGLTVAPVRARRAWGLGVSGWF